ncbi:TPR domain-containing protein [Rhizophagus clarus]|uniref:TPR domain-containing protein n=1 Tax=Rhizophagus clarus TaxID=94130 RepID=A0A8H3MAM6_9GLOM|nr:TPR domain-containing protein [Rhizophagus clarus]
MNTRTRKNIVFVHGKRYTILPTLSLQGFIAIDIMEGSCTKERFKNFVISDVLPKINPFSGPNSVIVLDNAKIHHNNDLIEYLQAFEICVEFLPPYSSDLNPIETAFSQVFILYLQW